MDKKTQLIIVVLMIIGIFLFGKQFGLFSVLPNQIYKISQSGPAPYMSKDLASGRETIFQLLSPNCNCITPVGTLVYEIRPGNKYTNFRLQFQHSFSFGALTTAHNVDINVYIYNWINSQYELLDSFAKESNTEATLSIRTYEKEGVRYQNDLGDVKLKIEYIYKSTTGLVSNYYFQINLLEDVTAPCQESWSCTAWSACSGGTQTRTCTDANSCGTTTSKPIESQSCIVSSNVQFRGTSTHPEDSGRIYAFSQTCGSTLTKYMNTIKGHYFYGQTCDEQPETGTLLLSGVFDNVCSVNSVFCPNNPGWDMWSLQGTDGIVFCHESGSIVSDSYYLCPSCVISDSKDSNIEPSTVMIQGCVTACQESWSCTAWSTCTAGTQTRTCTDANSCQSPRTESQSCTQYCGNNITDGTEACDGTDLGGQDCVAQGYSSGTLTCLSSCDGYIKSNCTIATTTTNGGTTSGGSGGGGGGGGGSTPTTTEEEEEPPTTQLIECKSYQTKDATTGKCKTSGLTYLLIIAGIFGAIWYFKKYGK